MFLLLMALSLPPNNGLLAAKDPLLLLGRGGVVRLGLPESILDHPEVRGLLDTGLTTSFVHTVSLRDGAGTEHEGKVLVDVFYEPWDHSWHVTARTRKAVKEARFDDYKGFSLWWREAHLELLQLPQVALSKRDARVLVEVIPFSEAEQRVAQKWFTQSVRGGVSGAEARSQSNLPAASVFDMFLATSIKRHALLDFRWKVPLSR